MSSSSRKNEEEQATRMPSQRAVILAHGIRKIRARAKKNNSQYVDAGRAELERSRNSIKLDRIKHNEAYGLMLNRNPDRCSE
jgi:hypothetical protein